MKYSIVNKTNLQQEHLKLQAAHDETVRQMQEKLRRTEQALQFAQKHLRLIAAYEQDVCGGQHESSRPWLFASAGLKQLDLNVGHLSERHKKILIAGKIASTLEMGKGGKAATERHDIHWHDLRRTKK